MLRATFAFLAFACTAAAAPVPPLPRALPESWLVGVWDYEWCDGRGYIAFNRDHTYSSVFTNASGYIYAGKWRLDGNTLILEERGYNVEMGTETEATSEVIELDIKRYPSIKGKTSQGNRATLSNPRR